MPIFEGTSKCTVGAILGLKLSQQMRLNGTRTSLDVPVEPHEAVAEVSRIGNV